MFSDGVAGTALLVPGTYKVGGCVRLHAGEVLATVITPVAM
jgi:hypothetical protein